MKSLVRLFDSPPTIEINPATGLPMTGNGTAGLDVEGNPYGCDLSDRHDWGATTSNFGGTDHGTSGDWSSHSFGGFGSSHFD